MTSKRIIIKIFALIFISDSIAQAAFANNEEVWIDVRTAEEFNLGHFKNAKNIPYNEIKNNLNLLPTDKSIDIYVYCRSGRRSNIAKMYLNELGYLNVIDRGGLENLKF